MRPLKVRLGFEKKIGEVWLSNKKRGICTDCNLLKPLYYSFVLSSGKVLVQSCQDCFIKFDYFSSNREFKYD